MALWWFKDKDVKIMALEVWNNKCYNCDIPEESPARKPGLLHTLCVGIEEELIEDGGPFDDFKKYYINDYHFERFD